MEERVKHLRSLIEQMPIDELEIKEYPFVSRINANTWVEVLLIYLVDPKHLPCAPRLLKKYWLHCCNSWIK